MVCWHFFKIRHSDESPLFLSVLGDKCDLSGTIPSSGLSSQPNLEHLKLEDCNLYGRIPSTIGTLRKLTSLELGENKLKGIIPQEMQALSELQTLELYDNILTGALPNLLNLSSLSVLDVVSFVMTINYLCLWVTFFSPPLYTLTELQRRPFNRCIQCLFKSADFTYRSLL